MDVGLEGVAQLAARLARVHDGVLDLSEPNRAMGQLVARAATVTAPHRSGALAASDTLTVTGSGWGIAYGQPYAMPVHFGTRYMRARPWLTTAARDTENSWLDVLTQHLQTLMD